MPDLTERYLIRLKQLTEAYGLAWDYAPLHAHLKRTWATGRPSFAPLGAGSESLDLSAAPILT